MVRPKSVLSDTGQELMHRVVTAARAATAAETALHDAVDYARQAAQQKFSRPAPGRLL